MEEKIARNYLQAEMIRTEREEINYICRARLLLFSLCFGLVVSI